MNAAVKLVLSVCRCVPRSMAPTHIGTEKNGGCEIILARKACAMYHCPNP